MTAIQSINKFAKPLGDAVTERDKIEARQNDLAADALADGAPADLVKLYETGEKQLEKAKTNVRRLEAAFRTETARIAKRNREAARKARDQQLGKLESHVVDQVLPAARKVNAAIRDLLEGTGELRQAAIDAAKLSPLPHVKVAPPGGGTLHIDLAYAGPHLAEPIVRALQRGGLIGGNAGPGPTDVFETVERQHQMVINALTHHFAVEDAAEDAEAE